MAYKNLLKRQRWFGDRITIENRRLYIGKRTKCKLPKRHRRGGFDWFTSCRAIDAMVMFNTPFRGQQELSLIGVEQTTSLLVVMIQIVVYRTVYQQCCHSERSTKCGVEESSHFAAFCSQFGARILRLAVARSG